MTEADGEKILFMLLLVGSSSVAASLDRCCKPRTTEGPFFAPLQKLLIVISRSAVGTHTLG